MVRSNSRIALLVLVAAVVACSVANALEPDPSHSILSSRYITLHGATNGVPDRGNVSGRPGEWYVLARDFANVPVANAVITIDFSGCPDIQISCDQLTAQTGQTYEAGKRVTIIADANGRATFYVQGAANSTSSLSPPFVSDGTNAGVPCAQVYQDGVPLGSLMVSAWDIDGLGSSNHAAINAADVAKVMIEALVGTGIGGKARSDLTYDNKVNAADVGFLASVVLARGGFNLVTGPYCP